MHYLRPGYIWTSSTDPGPISLRFMCASVQYRSRSGKDASPARRSRSGFSDNLKASPKAKRRLLRWEFSNICDGGGLFGNRIYVWSMYGCKIFRLRVMDNHK
ncbi:hypothetical protein Trydic_g21225 [Trypoxylus dichotomus]